MSQKRSKVATGKRSIWSTGHDQMQPIIGRRYQSRNSSLKRWRVSQSSIGSSMDSSVSPAASAVASRLNRSRSNSIRQNFGRSRLARWANTVSRLQPLHSMSALGACTEKDISDLAISTPSVSNSLSKFG